MRKKTKSLILFLGILLITTGCRENKESQDNIKSNTVSISNSKRLISTKYTKKKKNNNIEELSFKEFEKEKGKQNSVFVFIGDPKGKGYAQALSKFSNACSEAGGKLYTLNTNNSDVKNFVKRDGIISEPYDAVLLTKGHMTYLQIKNNGIPPIPVLKQMSLGNNETMRE